MDPQSSKERQKIIGHHLNVMIEEGAYENGYRIAKGQAAGWKFFQSSTAPSEIAIGGKSESGPFYLSIAHQGVAKDVKFSTAEPCAKGHEAAYVFMDRDALFSAISEVYRKSRSLPTKPYEDFVDQTMHLGNTETDRQIKIRIGQSIFRDKLMEYWNGRCPMTGISDPDLLIASHVISWSKCESDEERLNVYNGILLSALWDAAFDKGLISFDDNGEVLTSPKLTQRAAEELSIGNAPPLPITDEHRGRLTWHREYFKFEG